MTNETTRLCAQTTHCVRAHEPNEQNTRTRVDNRGEPYRAGRARHAPSTHILRNGQTLAKVAR